MDDQYPLKILVDSNQLTPGNSAKVLNPFWKVVEREVHQQGYLEVFQKLSFKLVNWPEKSWPRSQGKPGSKPGQTGNIGKHPAGTAAALDLAESDSFQYAGLVNEEKADLHILLICIAWRYTAQTSKSWKFEDNWFFFEGKKKHDAVCALWSHHKVHPFLTWYTLNLSVQSCSIFSDAPVWSKSRNGLRPWIWKRPNNRCGSYYTKSTKLLAWNWIQLTYKLQPTCTRISNQIPTESLEATQGFQKNCDVQMLHVICFHVSTQWTNRILRFGPSESQSGPPGTSSLVPHVEASCTVVSYVTPPGMS